MEIYTRPVNTYKNQVSNTHTLYPNAIRIELGEKVYNDLCRDVDFWKKLEEGIVYDIGFTLCKYEDAWINNPNSLIKLISNIQEILNHNKRYKHYDYIMQLKSICQYAVKEEKWVVFDL
jgi:hypothetical protein